MSDSERLRHYLLIFDHEKRKLLQAPEEHIDTGKAVRAYAAAESKYERQDRVEVVLIGSDSLETVAQTHPNFFGASSLMDKLLSKAM